MSMSSRIARRIARCSAISAAMAQLIMPRPSAIAEALAQHDAHMVAFFLASADAHVRDFRSAQIDGEDGMVLVEHAAILGVSL